MHFPLYRPSVFFKDVAVKEYCEHLEKRSTYFVIWTLRTCFPKNKASKNDQIQVTFPEGKLQLHRFVRMTCATLLNLHYINDMCVGRGRCLMLCVFPFILL